MDLVSVLEMVPVKAMEQALEQVKAQASVLEAASAQEWDLAAELAMALV